MKVKLLQFFTGKMGKSVYIAIASAVVCGAVVITSTVIVHNNNQKIDSVLEGLSASESVSESASESVTENVSDTDNINSQPQAKAPNGEPAGDKALQYLAEYDKLTAEYQAKRAELEKISNSAVLKKVITENISSKPQRKIWNGSPNTPKEEIEKRQKELDLEYERQLKIWENESQSVAQSAAIAREEEEQRVINEQTRIDNAKKQLVALDESYEKDVTALKEKYGIA